MEKTIINFIKENLSLDCEITANTKLLEDAILDSFGLIDLLCFIETTFSINIPDDEFDVNSFSDINSIIKLIQRLQ